MSRTAATIRLPGRAGNRHPARRPTCAATEPTSSLSRARSEALESLGCCGFLDSFEPSPTSSRRGCTCTACLDTRASPGYCQRGSASWPSARPRCRSPRAGRGPSFLPDRSTLRSSGTRTRSCGPYVFVEEPSEEISPFDGGHTVGLFDRRNALRYPKLQASMRASPVVVLHIDRKDAIEMP